MKKGRRGRMTNNRVIRSATLISSKSNKIRRKRGRRERRIIRLLSQRSKSKKHKLQLKEKIPKTTTDSNTTLWQVMTCKCKNQSFNLF